MLLVHSGTLPAVCNAVGHGAQTCPAKRCRLIDSTPACHLWFTVRTLLLNKLHVNLLHPRPKTPISQPFQTKNVKILNSQETSKTLVTRMCNIRILPVMYFILGRVQSKYEPNRLHFVACIHQNTIASFTFQKCTLAHFLV